MFTAVVPDAPTPNPDKNGATGSHPRTDGPPRRTGTARPSEYGRHSGDGAVAVRRRAQGFRPGFIYLSAPSNMSRMGGR